MRKTEDNLIINNQPANTFIYKRQVYVDTKKKKITTFLSFTRKGGHFYD